MSLGPNVTASFKPIRHSRCNLVRVSYGPSFHPYLPLNKLCMYLALQLKKRKMIYIYPSVLVPSPMRLLGLERSCTFDTLYLRVQPERREDRPNQDPVRCSLFVFYLDSKWWFLCLKVKMKGEYNIFYLVTMV